MGYNGFKAMCKCKSVELEDVSDVLCMALIKVDVNTDVLICK